MKLILSCRHLDLGRQPDGKVDTLLDRAGGSTVKDFYGLAKCNTNTSFVRCRTRSDLIRKVSATY